MDKNQKWHLEARLRVATERMRKRLYGRRASTTPAAVTAAKRLVNRWERGHWEKEHREKTRVACIIERKRERVDEAMLFGDSAKALAAVKKFEQAAKRA